MNALIILGSPSGLDSASARLALNFANGLKDGDYEVNVEVLADKPINHCRGCKACWLNSPEKCAQSDEMTKILGLMRTADLIVLATPLYYFSVPGRVKDFIDRQLPLNYGSFLKAIGKIPLDTPVWPEQKKIILISPCGFPGENNFDALTLMMKKIYGSAFVEQFLVPSAGSLSNDHDQSKHQEIYQLMRSVGTEFAKHGAISPASRDQFGRTIATLSVNRMVNLPA